MQVSPNSAYKIGFRIRGENWLKDCIFFSLVLEFHTVVLTV